MAEADFAPMEYEMEGAEQQAGADESDSDEVINQQADEEDEDYEEASESKETEEPEVRHGWWPALVVGSLHRWVRQFLTAQHSVCLQDEGNAAEVAKQEKERLKQQQSQKKQLIEKMREEQNALAEQGEVSSSIATGYAGQSHDAWIHLGWPWLEVAAVVLTLPPCCMCRQRARRTGCSSCCARPKSSSTSRQQKHCRRRPPRSKSLRQFCMVYVTGKPCAAYGPVPG